MTDRRWKPEATMVWGPEGFSFLSETVRDLLNEAKECRKDVEVLSEHREVGEFELRIRIVPSGNRKIDLPPITVTR